MTLVEGFCPRWRLLVFGLIASILIVATVVRVVLQGDSLGFSPLHGTTFTSTSTVTTVFDQWKEKLGCDDATLDICWNTIELVVEKEKANKKLAEERTAIALYRAKLSAAGDAYPNIKLVQEHPALIPLLPQYQYTYQQQNAFPDLNVVGMAKAGTSQLYRILAQHPGAQALDPTEKEVCMLGAEHTVWELQPVSQEMTNVKAQVQANLFKWHSGLAAAMTMGSENNNDTQKPVVSPKIMTVNGCVNWHDLWLHLHYAHPVGKKYFLVLRDPADWLWATWNFWIDASLDSQQNGNEKQWANVKTHYRSPELFHELILSDLQTLSGANMLVGLKQGTAVYGRRLVSLVGRENVLFLRNEDLLPDQIDLPGGVLDRISKFTGLDRNQFTGQEGLHSFTNCNDEKGLRNDCGNFTRRGAYEISGNRTLLEATRKFIYLKFWEECKIYANEFGVVYPNCLNVMQSTDTAAR
jgi:hypothetical protein